MITKLKYRLGHVSDKSWHWKVTEFVYGRRAQGKACTYYWFKVPTSVIAYAALAAVASVLQGVRILYIVVAWIFGYRFIGKLFDLDDEITCQRNFTDYKERPDGTRFRFAPWEYLLLPLSVWVLGTLIFEYFDMTVKIIAWLVATSVVFSVATLTLFILSAVWQHPPFVRARARAVSAWNRACLPLVVEGANHGTVEDDTD